MSSFAAELFPIPRAASLLCHAHLLFREALYSIVSLLVRDEGANRFVYGATHAAYQDRERRFEIICLKDLIGFLRDPAPVTAAHEQRFK